MDMTNLPSLLERYIDAADELERVQRGLLPIADATDAFVSARDALRADPEFSGTLPKTFFSGSYLDPDGVDGNGSDGCTPSA
jgi:hypothetical protein